MIEPAQAAAWEPRYAGRARRMAASEIRELLKVVDQPGVLSFAGGIPEPALFPVEEAKAAYAAVLGASSAGLQYSVSEGYPPLRRWIVRHMVTLGVPCDADNIITLFARASDATPPFPCASPRKPSIVRPPIHGSSIACRRWLPC